MLHTYLKSLLLSTLLLNASPKTFNSLGNELEKFQNDCKDFQSISLLPKQIKKECTNYISNVDKVFKVGYKTDSTSSEKQLNYYLTLLQKSDEKKSYILHLILLEKQKARKENNFSYYDQLITKDIIELFDNDYEFMKKNIETFSQNKRYLSHQEHLKALEKAKQTNLELENKKREVLQANRYYPSPQRDRRQNYSNNNSLLSYVDHVSGSALLDDGVLSLNIFYINRDTDKQVVWKNDVAHVTCNAYINSGDFLRPVKGYEIGSITNKAVTNSFQKVYMDVVTSFSGRDGMLICTLNTPYHTFKFTETFLLK